MHPRVLIVKALQRAKVNRLAHKIYYSTFHRFDTANKALLPALERCFDLAIELGIASKGDYFEFGLFKGYSFWFAQNLAKQRTLDSMRFFGFDSFKGLPKVEQIDQSEMDDFYKGQFACSIDSVRKNLDSRGVDWSRTFLIEGFYSESLSEGVKKQHGMKSVAISLIDCDLYESTRDVLEFLADILADQSILLFDDWNCFDANPEKGQRRAFREFMVKNSHLEARELFSYGLYGQVFIVEKNGNLSRPGSS